MPLPLTWASRAGSAGEEGYLGAATAGLGAIRPTPPHTMGPFKGILHFPMHHQLQPWLSTLHRCTGQCRHVVAIHIACRHDAPEDALPFRSCCPLVSTQGTSTACCITLQCIALHKVDEPGLHQLNVWTQGLLQHHRLLHSSVLHWIHSHNC